MRGRQCDPLLWCRFNYDKTSKTSKLRESLIYKFMSFSVPGPCSNRDVVERISAESGIPIESLSDDLRQTVSPRPRVVFGFVGDEFDKIAQYYDHMQWWLSDGGLNITVVKPVNPVPNPPSLEELMSPLTVHLKSRKRTGGRPKVLLSIDGKLVREIRGDENQETFAMACRIRSESISVDTLQKAEKQNLATMKTLQRICRHPKLKLGNYSPRTS